MANMLGEGWLEDVKTKPKEFLEKTFFKSCEKGYLDRIIHLFTYTEIKNDPHVQNTLNQGLYIAAKSGHLNIVQYLLTSDNLLVHADIHFDNDAAFTTSANYGHLDVVKFLTSSLELKEHADVHAKGGAGILMAIAFRRMDVVQYLIFDSKIEITDMIVKFTKGRKNPQIEKWLEQKVLNKNLNETLPSDNLNKNNKKNKI